MGATPKNVAPIYLIVTYNKLLLKNNKKNFFLLLNKKANASI
jgi:hypothetical protein